MEARAERERKAAEDARRAAEEAAARARLAQEAAAKEAAQRRAEQERRAAEDARRAADAAAQARAARLAQEEAARTRAAQDARAAQEAAARARAAQEDAARQRQVAAKQQGTSVMRITWHDHALRFTGTLTGKPSSASLQATIYDIKTGAQIGNYDVPASVTKQGEDFIVTGTFQVPRDSVTPHPHTHTSRLLLRRQSDGTLRYIENCPQQGKQCYR
jgi:membrane protein involved in colicin uptake